MPFSIGAPLGLGTRHFQTYRSGAHLVLASAGPHVRYTTTHFRPSLPAKSSVGAARVLLQQHLKLQNLAVPKDSLQLLSQDGDDYVFQSQQPANSKESAPATKTFKALKEEADNVGLHIKEQARKMDEQARKIDEVASDLELVKKKLAFHQIAIVKGFAPMMVKALRDSNRRDKLLSLGYTDGDRLESLVMRWPQTLKKLSARQKKEYKEGTSAAFRAFLEIGEGTFLMSTGTAAEWIDQTSEEEEDQAHLAYAVSRSRLSDLERLGAIEGFESIFKDTTYESRLAAAKLLFE